MDCGQGHGGDCLCDIVVEEPTPIRFGLHEVMLGQEVAEAYGISGPYDGQEMARFGEAILKAYDAYRAVQNARSLLTGEEDQEQRLAELTASVKSLLREGHSIIDLPDMLGRPLVKIVFALFGGRPTPTITWSDMDWLKFESLLAELPSNTSYMKIAKAMGINQGATRRLCLVYRPELLKYSAKGGYHKVEQQAKINAIVEKHPTLSTLAVAEKIMKELGITYTPSAVRATRRRMAARAAEGKKAANPDRILDAVGQ